MPNKNLEYKFYYRRNLPHYQPKDYLFFITYRLAFTLPKLVLNRLAEKRNEFDKLLKNIDIENQLREKLNFNSIIFAIKDDFLGKYQDGPHWLKNNKIAEIVIDSLFYNHKKQYELLCYTIMSNHVHIIIKPRTKTKDIPFSLSQIIQSHKSFTGHIANKIIKRSGQFWQHENYDHYIRDRNELNRIIRYILRNPVKAGLVENYQDWKYSWLNENAL